jgi:hypothetical protein
LRKFSALGQPAPQIGYRFGIERVVGRRAHLRASSGPAFRADHTVIAMSRYRLSIGTIKRGSDYHQTISATLGPSGDVSLFSRLLKLR